MASASELDEVELSLINCKSSVPPADLIVKYLKISRELKIRDSQVVARYGSILLRNYKNILAEEEKWLVHEQVAVASLDCGAIPFATDLIRAVARRFPESSRTRRLQGMFWEASGNPEKAIEIYQDVLTAKPSDEIAAKRLIAVEKTRGNTLAAAEALKKYLDIYSGDREAWEELAELYLELLMYKQALFCFEELLMFNPLNPQYLVAYADVLYTIGSFRLARSYYSKAVEASLGSSNRALFGILACYANITEKVSLQDSKTRAQIELPDLSAQALIKLYRQNAPDKLPLLEPMLKKLNLI
ncbi:hypothetical protein CEUSTIGMA_g11795.t1 [Chlamydomonas eustigma]|uniref:ER membrane protein complex subunit 2 n=1 Tax=Chlamydomonas eustigma TaxID=1157962 RepID=A0A250XMY8_9CHLO|nr:hypothetical protein CEUSTIGMA_g11795.t1 [Chlamydomonas eustigma]|eukprot:GAX84373.1 hypothetical protein CEUSTIGMA_g11795.t1 [Chlamydomonas eustigma]